MQPLKTKAIVLRRTNYGEADRILQLLTPNNAKVGVMARGVRKQKSKLASGIELFSVSEITIHRGKSDLGILTSARLDYFCSNIMSDYDRLQFGYEVLKQANKVAENIHEESLFEIVEIAFKSLDNLEIDLRIVKIWFYLQIAELLGHGLNLSRDDNNKQLEVDASYRFDIAEMSFSKDSRGHFTAGHLKVLKLLKLKSPKVVNNISGINEYLDDCLSLAHALNE